MSMGNGKDLFPAASLVHRNALIPIFVVRILDVEPAAQCMYYVLCNHITDIMSFSYVSSVWSEVPWLKNRWSER